MAWFLNHYECNRCEETWDDEWSCMCDDECPHCGARDTSPFDSDDLTYLVVDDVHSFVVFRSADTAGHDPDYREIGRFLYKDFAETFARTEPGERII